LVLASVNVTLTGSVPLVGVPVKDATGAAAVTVRVKVSWVERAPPSSTDTVTVAVPACPTTGVRVIVRVAPDPPRLMFASGRTVWLELVAVTVRAPAAVSASETVNETGPTGVPHVVV
jgi:hypothetical protein